MVSWEPREESVSTGQLVIPPRAHYNSRELLLPQVFTCACTHVGSLVLSPPAPRASLPSLPPPRPLLPFPPICHTFTDSVLIFLLSRAPGSPSLGLKSLDNVDFSDLLFFTISLPYILQKLSKKYTCPMRKKGGV